MTTDSQLDPRSRRPAAGAAAGARPRLPVAREGWPFVLVPLALAAAAAAAGWPLLAGPALLAGLFSLWFFRDPERRGPDDPELLLAPADGRVMAVDAGPEGLTVAIFLGLLDVHVNRAPFGGVVTATARRGGRFLAAYKTEAGEWNARNDIDIETERGVLRVSQITGLIARRIVCRVGPGTRVRRGERLGLIRFGSRTDLVAPAGAEPLVAVGDRVRGGETAIARWRATGGGPR